MVGGTIGRRKPLVNPEGGLLLEVSDIFERIRFVPNLTAAQTTATMGKQQVTFGEEELQGTGLRVPVSSLGTPMKPTPAAAGFAP